MNTQRGLTLTEIIVVITIFLIILAIGFAAMKGTSQKKELDTIVENIASELDRAKAESILGKSGKNHGVKFNSNSIVIFAGTFYDPADATNVTHSFSAKYTIGNNLANADKIILFARMTGIPAEGGTITVTEDANPSNTESITVGAQGDITVVK